MRLATVAGSREEHADSGSVGCRLLAASRWVTASVASSTTASRSAGEDSPRSTWWGVAAGRVGARRQSWRARWARGTLNGGRAGIQTSGAPATGRQNAARPLPPGYRCSLSRRGTPCREAASPGRARNPRVRRPAPPARCPRRPRIRVRAAVTRRANGGVRAGAGPLRVPEE